MGGKWRVRDIRGEGGREVKGERHWGRRWEGGEG